MVQTDLSLDAQALEILILAFAFLSLICFFAIVILTGANFRRLSGAERAERVTAWGAAWHPENEDEDIDPYSDEAFIDSVRRQSASWANEVKGELRCFTERLLPKRMSDDPSPLDLVAGSLRRLSEIATSEIRESVVGVKCEQGTCHAEGVPAIASGRDEGDAESKRRSTKTESTESEHLRDSSQRTRLSDPKAGEVEDCDVSEEKG